MVAARKFIDNAPTTTLTGPITSGATNPTVTSLAGYPAQYPYEATIDLGTASAEQVLVTANPSGTTLTVTRNYNGLGAFSHPAGATFNHTANALDYQEANDHIVASTAVHGVTGSVVGTGGVQTLTNKTLTSPALTNPAITSGAGTLTLPTTTDTLVGRATTDTLTNKTLNGATLDAATTFGGVSGTTLAADRTAWTAYTPTFTNITGGAGAFAYKLIGKTLHLRFAFTAGTATATANVGFSAPGGATAPNFQLVPAVTSTSAFVAWRTGSGLADFTSYATKAAGTNIFDVGQAVIEVA